mmetsp:Transcript_94515/g.115772  ORF Transcript_94515/g.115772 Transcript_94515/m.115772 type:complete len:366 (-) Transcript_94515:40-1137(-)
MSFKTSELESSLKTPGLVLLILCLIQMLQLLIFICKYCIYKYKHSNVSKASLILIILSSIGYIVSTLLYTINYTNYLTPMQQRGILQLCGDLFWSIARILMYSYLLKRLYDDLKIFNYGISFNIMAMLALTLCVYGISVGIVLDDAITSMIANDTYNISDDSKVFIIISMTIDFILLTMFLVIFIYKFHQSISFIQQIYEDATRAPRIRRRAGSLQYEDNILEIPPRESQLMILSIVVIIISQIMYITIGTYYTSAVNGDINDERFPMFYDYLKGIHSILVPLLLFMSFEFMNNWYRCCFNTCDICVQRHIVNKLNRILILKEPLLNSQLKNPTFNDSHNTRYSGKTVTGTTLFTKYSQTGTHTS